MRHRILHLAASLLTLLFVLPAGAAFHLFTINEAYSNASGTVQYLELTALTGGQQFTQGHTLVSSAPAQPTRSFTLLSNLPGDTSGRKMLFGTAGVQAAFGVTPDYIIPDGFLHIVAGQFNWGEGSDVWGHPAIPTNGTALNRDGSTSVPSPQNFAGSTGTPPPPPPPADTTFQALWWAFPAGSENGWGVNVAHQGNTLFVTWFTYDTDGNGLWLVMSNAERTSAGVYTGQIFRTTGPPFNTVPSATPIVVTPVGTGTFTFTTPTRGTFAYTVNDISQTKEIVRQEYASPVPDVHRRRDAERPPELPGPLVDVAACRFRARLGPQPHAPGRHSLRHVVHVRRRRPRHVAGDAQRADARAARRSRARSTARAATPSTARLGTPPRSSSRRSAPGRSRSRTPTTGPSRTRSMA